MTIVEVYSAASQMQKNNILAALMKKGAGQSTAYQWCTGRRRPSKMLRPTVASILNKEMKANYTETELWPEA